MSVLENIPAPAAPPEPPATPTRRAASRTSLRARITGAPRALVFGGVLMGFILLVLALTPWITPADPNAQDLANRLAGPSAEHWLGTDQLGRDVLSRLMTGGRFSVSIAAITLAISAVAGTLIGMISARKGGALDEFVMRLTDVLLSFPEMVVALFLVAVLRPSYTTLILALTIGGWTPFARLARGLTMEINSRDYIEAAEALGCSRRFIILRHVLPNALSPLLAHAALRFGHKLISVGALSFLGLGVQPPDSDWGAMLSDAQPYMLRNPVLVLAPGLAIFIAALAVTYIGQGLDAHRRRRNLVQDLTDLPADTPSAAAKDGDR